MILYSYFRSSASYRVRLGFAIKGIEPDEMRYVNLRQGEQSAAAYAAINPQGLVPALAFPDRTVLTQSLPILEYLDEAFPHTRRLLPEEPLARAKIRAITQAIACEIQPLLNLRTLKEMNRIGGEDTKNAWAEHWLGKGLSAIEALVPDADFVHGMAPGLAECFILPQLFSARRFNHDLTPYPNLCRIEAATSAWPGVESAHPEQQADYAV